MIAEINSEMATERASEVSTERKRLLTELLHEYRNGHVTDEQIAFALTDNPAERQAKEEIRRLQRDCPEITRVGEWFRHYTAQGIDPVELIEMVTR